MAIVWGAYVTASGGYGMRIGIDLSFSAVTHTTKTCTATYKIYTQNSGTWDPPDDQIMEFDGNYSLPEQVPFTNVGTEATKGDIILRTTKTYTWTYTATSYGTSSLPQEADLVVDVIHTRPIYYPHCEVHVMFPIRPYATPSPPTTIALARVSDTNNKITWVNTPTAGEPYDAVWIERYIYGYATWARIGTLAKTVALYNDTGAIPNRKYAYRVQADNSVGTSAYIQSGIIYTTPDLPTAPSRSVVAGNQVLTWAQAIGYTEYETEVWRSTDGVWALLATVGTGVTTYTDTTALTNQKVKYRFRTKTSANTPVLYSVDSAETTETTGVPTAPAAPTPTKPITGTIDPTGPIVHTWTHNPTDGSLQTFFEVQYRHVGDAVWKTSGKVASATASWTMPKNSVSKGNQIEWQVRTYGFSSTLASPWSASAKWMTTPAIPLKYPMFLDVDTGRTEASSQVKLITEQTRRVATVAKTTGGTTQAAAYNICSYTLPAELARTGKKFRIQGECNLVPNTDGMYTDLRIYIGVGATTSGTQIGSGYVDHRIANRNVNGFVLCEYVFDPATAGGENITTINIVLVGVPVGGSSFSAQAANRPGYLIIDEIIEGASTASSPGTYAPSGTQIVAGNGLTGGGDLTANRSIDLVPADATLIVNPDSVQVNTAVMATRAYADSAGGGGSGGPDGANEVVIDVVQPVPVASHPELWIDLNDSSGELPALTSGVWAAPPLDVYGANTLIGREIYLDSAGKLRARPEEVTGKKPTDLAPTWPAGTSIFYVPNADAALWPGGSQVVTHKTNNGVIAQWCYMWSSATTRAWYRNGTATAWSPWVTVADSAPASNDSGWINVEYAADWDDYGSSYQAGQYRKVGTDVRLRGLIKSAVIRSAASTMFILPVGFRPTVTEIFNGTASVSMISGAASTGTAHTHTSGYQVPIRVDVISSSGVVNCTLTASETMAVGGWVSVSGIAFSTT